MSITVSAKEANQHFAEMLGKAEAGETVVITKRGVPVATLKPYRPEAACPERRAAWADLLASLERGAPIGITATEARAWKFDRDEAHER
jgi:prevent-host-death family protein